MIVLLIVVSIIFILSLLIFIFLLSNISLEITDLKMVKRLKKIKTNNSYKIILKIKFLDKIPIFFIKINEKKLNRIRKENFISKLNYKSFNNDISIKDVLKIFKKLKIRIKKLNLFISIGTDDVVATSTAVTGLSIALSSILPHLVERKDISRCRYEIFPIYNENNLFTTYIDTIIKIRIVDILNALLRIREIK